MQDEDVNPMMGTNMQISQLLAKKYGSEEIEKLYLLLGNPTFAKAIESLRQQFGIKIYGKSILDISAQQYIADAVAKQDGRLVETASDFEEYYGRFLQVIRETPELADSKQIANDVIAQYLVKGDQFLSEQQPGRVISVSMDKRTKDLTIKLRHDATNRDLRAVTSEIFKSWNRLRGAPPKRQPSDLASLHSRVTRYAKEYGEITTAKEFNLERENVHQIVKRSNSRRKKIQG